MWYASWYFAVITIIATSFTLVRGFGQVLCGLWLFSPANGEVKPPSNDFNQVKDNGIYFQGIKGVATLLLCFGFAAIIAAYLVLKGIFKDIEAVFIPWLIEEAAFIVVLLISIIELHIEVQVLKILLPITLFINVICFTIVILYYKGLVLSNKHQDSQKDSQKKVTFKDKPDINIISESSTIASEVKNTPTDSEA